MQHYKHQTIPPAPLEGRHWPRNVRETEKASGKGGQGSSQAWCSQFLLCTHGPSLNILYHLHSAQFTAICSQWILARKRVHNLPHTANPQRNRRSRRVARRPDMEKEIHWLQPFAFLPWSTQSRAQHPWCSLLANSKPRAWLYLLLPMWDTHLWSVPPTFPDTHMPVPPSCHCG